LQNDYECLYCVVDMHAITVWQDPALISSQTREIAAAFLAAGCRRQEAHDLQPIDGAASTPSSPGSSTAWRGWVG